MKFVFEAKASDYDLAAEQRSCCATSANRKAQLDEGAVILCAATVVLCILLVIFGQGTKRGHGMVVGVICFAAGLSGLYEQPKGVSQAALPWAENQTYADLK